MQIAKTILKQLGGNKFLVMTGAKNLLALENGISMKLPRNKSKANYLRIKLNSLDLYDIEFIRIHGSKLTEVKTYNNIYADQLTKLFTETTGMHTRLF